MTKRYWDYNEQFASNTAVIDNNISKTYDEVFYLKESFGSKLKGYCTKKELAFIFCSNDYHSIIYYLSCLTAGVAVLLLENKLNDELSDFLIKEYKPKFIFFPDDKEIEGFCRMKFNNGLSFLLAKEDPVYKIHDDLAVLLSTSGTTGSPKLVKLAYKNIQSNAESIAEYLKIQRDDRSITSLPMSYSFGLSVINSYLLSGTSLCLSNENIVFKNFWNTFNHYKCTSFSGVPYSYMILKKTGFENLELPTLKTMTQAGGRLSNDLIQFYHELSLKKNFNFFVMYGQTEATARISYVPPVMLSEKIGSIGIPIPGGELNVIDEKNYILKPLETGEIVYKGNNVMMGYANCLADLANGDELKGTLKTGDLGYIDNDGYFFITGRSKRFIKISGLRVNLDEVEKLIENHFGIFNACIGEDDMLQVLVQSHNSAELLKIHQQITEYFKLPKNTINIKGTEVVPAVPSGKKDYTEIKRIFQNPVQLAEGEGTLFL